MFSFLEKMLSFFETPLETMLCFVEDNARFCWRQCSLLLETMLSFVGDKALFCWRLCSLSLETMLCFETPLVETLLSFVGDNTLFGWRQRSLFFGDNAIFVGGNAVFVGDNVLFVGDNAHFVGNKRYPSRLRWISLTTLTLGSFADNGATLRSHDGPERRGPKREKGAPSPVLSVSYCECD